MTEKPRDLLWEALVEVCGGDSATMTKSERGRYNHALKELREVSATPADIKARAGRYRQKYPGIDVTPTGLTAHWSSLRAPSRSDFKRVEQTLAAPDTGIGVAIGGPTWHEEMTEEQKAAADAAREKFYKELHETGLGELDDDRR